MAVDPDRLAAFFRGFNDAIGMRGRIEAGIEALDAYDFEQAVQSFNDADVISSGE